MEVFIIGKNNPQLAGYDNVRAVVICERHRAIRVAGVAARLALRCARMLLSFIVEPADDNSREYVCGDDTTFLGCLFVRSRRATFPWLTRRWTGVRRSQS